MKQIQKSGNNSQNIQIGTIDSNAKVDIKQIAVTYPYKHIKLQPDESYIVSKKELITSSLVGLCKLITSVIFTKILDYLFKISSFKIFTSYPSWLIIVLPVLFITIFIARKNIKNMYILLKIFQNYSILKKGKSIYLNQGKFIEKYNKNFIIYRPTAPCIYPHCSGKIIVVLPPPKEKNRIRFAGICSLAGKDHSYKIDYNLVATPAELDWSID